MESSSYVSNLCAHASFFLRRPLSFVKFLNKFHVLMNLPFLFAFHINPDVNCHVTVPTAAAINTLCTCAPSVLVRCVLIWSHTICRLLFLQHRKLGSNGNLQLARILKVQLNRWAIKCGVCTTTLGGDGYSLGSDLMGVFSLVWLALGQGHVDLLVYLDGWFVILLRKNTHQVWS